MSKIKVETKIHAPLSKVWKYWNSHVHIVNWAFASDEWEAPHAENDLREGGKFLTRMSAKDKSASFDFTGTYTTVIPEQKIKYIIQDHRQVEITFEKIKDDLTKVTEEFDPEDINPEELQRKGWQAILENFKKYVEGN
jgi:uncharacterized protein YndB with AHSA1/START domain